MSNKNLLIGAAAIGAAYFLFKRSQTQSTTSATPKQGYTAVGFTKLVRPTQAQAQVINLGNPGGSAVKPAAGLSGQDIAGGVGAVAAAAGCNAVPGVGTALSPLCGAGGAYLGAKAYDYGKQAVNWVGGLF